ncbi:PepSY domain-containing protein [Nitrospira moscoviensis]|uniref:Putative Propeptide PepSY amd peptidase M4 n=1 Tax=Nitrospira moscoviensis TaxID=42253 RepID=A0A0K2G9X8_NITMO|nr:PepSY domain-containing protein [Nitrospira moscoviensis]ALA57776.1 putative Propeptide PepSY amd peptidase M4 [Nitrospira moscoviensis]
MRFLLVPCAIALCTLAGCASQETMAKNARISTSEAARIAENSVPGGRAKETHLEQERGRTVYEVELVDNGNNTQTVWVDAESGRIVERDR